MGLLATLRNVGLQLRAQGDQLYVEPREALTDELRQTIRAHKPELLLELTEESERSRAAAAEGAHQEVIARLEAHPDIQRAFVTRHDGGVLVVTLAVRHVGTCELHIAADRVHGPQDWAALIACLEVSKEVAA